LAANAFFLPKYESNFSANDFPEKASCWRVCGAVFPCRIYPQNQPIKRLKFLKRGAKIIPDFR
jgi:hypothetical protein